MSDSRRESKKSSATTIVDVAKDAGVSHSTVSRVLNGHPHIKPDTRLRVEASLKKLGYVANLHARGLAGGRTGVVGLVVRHLGNSFINHLVREIDFALADVGLHLMLCTTQRRDDFEDSYFSRLSAGLVDGLIVIVPDGAPKTYPNRLIKQNLPFVLIDHVGGHRSTTLIGDSQSGADQIVAHLQGLGHERIAIITGDTDTFIGHQRLECFFQAMEAAGLDLPDPYVVEGDFSYQTGRTSMAKLLELKPRPTAVFASSDSAAFGALRTLDEHGVRVPQDMSIVGFDDTPETISSRHSLTTVRQPAQDMAATAVRLLRSQIESGELTTKTVTFPVQLIARGTTGPPRQS